VPLQIDFFTEDVQVVSECAEIIIYWRGSVYERRDAIQHFYSGAMQGMRNSVRWYETESMGEVRRVGSKTFDLLPRWLKEPRARRGMLALMLETASKPDASSDLAFSIFCDEEDSQPMGYIRLVTPSSVLDRDPALFLETAMYLVDGMDFESGTAGYAINWDRRSELSNLAEPHIARIAATYPGVEIPDPNTTLIALQNAERPAFKRVNWITFLGTNLSRSTRPEFGQEPGVRTYRLRNGQAVVAGPTPHRSGNLDAYRAVGHALAPWRVSEHAPLFGDDDDKTQRWLATFD
jgi:hypothetical protein